LAETLVSSRAGNGHVCLVQPAPLLGVWVGTVGVVRLVAGVGASCWVLKEQPCCVWGGCFGCPGHPGMAYHGVGPGGVGVGLVLCGGGGFGLFVENCTVDASIFVVKLSRANGGCLGTRSR
jgi:hypothetical protein